MPEPVFRDKDVFNVARRIEADDARDAYLDQVCGEDRGLRDRVELLLRMDRDAPEFLDRPALAQLMDGGPTEIASPTEQPGDAIGPYKLLQQIGEGGFGVVYMAEQTAPVRRRVALKIIKPGMDTQEVIGRFDAERQALAMMDHPNIARVLDAGATDSGRSYFVMELVRGAPITEYCDANRLTVRERLELIIPVCHAIQHAHQKGIIHRDIKPSNVLVSLYDGKPVPKVIDFGVAKAIQQPLVQKTLFTRFGQIIGTLEYMSPEQAELNQLDVDTRSDVYSLGVLLYELLTGTTPLTRERLQSAAFTEMLRLIREADPERPSARLSHSGASLATISAQRRSDPEKLPRQISGELDWIVVKALEKDRVRRYATAADLARDLERHLHDEPVEACPPSLGYRLRKTARRHRVALTTATAFAAVLILGAMLSSWQAIRARHAEAIAQRALMQAKVERDRAVQAQSEAVSAQQAARTAEAAAQAERDAALAARFEETQARRTAEADRQAREDALREATALRLTAQSSAVLDTNPGQALLLAIEGAQRGQRRAVHNNALMAALRACREERTLVHDAAIYWSAVSPDGRRLLTASRSWSQTPVSLGDHQVHVWDLATGRHLQTLRGHHLEITSAAFCPDGDRVVFTYGGGRREWQFRSGVRCIYTDRVARLFSLNSGKELAVISGHGETVRVAEFSPDGTRILTASYNRAQITDADTGDVVITLPAEQSSFLTAGFLAEGRRFFTVPSGYSRTGDYPNASNSAQCLVDPPAGVLPQALTQTDQLSGISSNGSASTHYVGLPHVLCLWDARTGQQFNRIALPVEAAQAPELDNMNQIQCFAVSPDERRVLAVGVVTDPDVPARRAALWDLESGNLVATLDCDRPIHSAQFRLDSRQLLTVSSSSEPAAWDAQTGDKLYALAGHEGPATAARYSHEGKWIVTASQDKTARLWSAVDGTPSEVLRGHEQPVSFADFALDDDRVITASPDGTARVWRLIGDSPCSRSLVAHTDALNSADFSPDGRRVVTASEDGTARLWDPATGQCLAVLRASAEQLDAFPTFEQDRILGAVWSAEFSADGGRILTLSDDRIVRIQHKDQSATAGQPEREEIVYTPARVWDPDSGTLLFGLAGSTTQVVCAAFSPSGKRILTAESQQANESLLTFRHGRVAGRGERSGSDSERETMVRIYDASTGRQQRALPHRGRISSAVFSPDERRVLTVCDRTESGRSITLWDADSGETVSVLGEPNGGVRWAVFSPDGKWVLAMQAIGASLLETGTGQVVARFGDVVDFASRDWQRTMPANPFSPDSRRVALPLQSPQAGPLGIWDVATAEQIASVTGHRGRIYSVEFSPDGSRIVSAGADETARIWNVETASEFLTISRHSGAVLSAQFSSDGQRIVTASADGTAHVSLCDPLPVALGRKPRDLTAEERVRFQVDADQFSP